MMTIDCHAFVGTRALTSSLLTLTITLPLIATFHRQGSAPGSGDSTAPQAPSEANLDQLLRFLDRDGDGVLHAHESAEAVLFLSKQADANDDGALQRSELNQYFQEQEAEERAERTEVFHEFDRNQDGALSRLELPSELKRSFDRLDTNLNGSIELQELLAAQDLENPRQMIERELIEFMQPFDEDGDGRFALVDMPAKERADFEADFARLDLDADGWLHEAELLKLADEELREASFEVHGERALMRGVIGRSTPGRVLELILEHPEVRTIEMLEVPGSIDDESCLRAAVMVRKRGLNTHLPHDGEVASGGTDFFLAGVQRTAEAGARFGVHSWSGFQEEGADLPEEDPEHEPYLEYCRSMGIDEEFYWFTLEAAPAAGIHWMSMEELKGFEVIHSR